MHSQQLKKWRNRNLYYYRDLEKLCQFLVQPRSSVLEVGSGLGYLLNSVEPKAGMGIDISSLAIEDAGQRFPELDFHAEDVEEFSPDRVFSYVLVANTLSYVQNIQKALHNIHKACEPSTRLVLSFHNPAWEPILKLAILIKQRMPLPFLNWLSFEDIENLLNLSGFEVISHDAQST